jgi:hypothetical protein
MVDRRRTEGELKEEFDVTGSTGNVSQPGDQSLLHLAHVLKDIHHHDMPHSFLQLPRLNERESLQAHRMSASFISVFSLIHPLQLFIFLKGMPSICW